MSNLANRGESLSARELEVLQAYADGDKGPDVCIRLKISQGTLGEYRKRIAKKLGTLTMAHAVAAGLRQELIR